jgi:hypothetical protein
MMSDAEKLRRVRWYSCGPLRSDRENDGPQEYQRALRKWLRVPLRGFAPSWLPPTDFVCEVVMHYRKAFEPIWPMLYHAIDFSGEYLDDRDANGFAAFRHAYAPRQPVRG